MFENIYPSADNHVTGIVGLLAATAMTNINITMTTSHLIIH
jgi:hypothetical protein